MRYRSIDVAALQIGGSNIIFGVGVVRRNPQRNPEFFHRFSHSALLQKRLAQIVMVFALVRPQFERSAKITNAFVDIAVRYQKGAEIAVGHPTSWIARNGCAPERFDIAIIVALAPTQSA